MSTESSRIPRTRGFFIDYVLDGRKWLPVAGGWRTESDNWGVLHDLLHHEPTDTGTVGQELATLGAELYLEYDVEDGSDNPKLDIDRDLALETLSGGAHGFIGADIHEHGKGPEHYVIEAAPAVEKMPPPEVLHILQKAAASVHEALSEHVLDDENWGQALASIKRTEVVLSWLVFGYVRAGERFPDKKRLAVGMADAKAKLTDLSQRKCGKTFRMSFSDYTLKARALPAKRTLKAAA